MRTHEQETVDVIVTTLGGTPQTLTMPKDSTVEAVLISAGYPESCEVRCNGEIVKNSDIIDAGDRLTILDGQKVKGGK